MERNEIFGYKNLVAYQRSKTLVNKVYTLLQNFPHEEQYALCDQLRRAVVSVTSNIAEGTSRATYPDKIHFLEIAYGSMMEVHSQMDIACDRGYISQDELISIEDIILSIVKPLSGLRTSYQAKLHKP